MRGLQTLGCVFPCMPTYADGSDTPYIIELNQRMEKNEKVAFRGAFGLPFHTKM